MSKGDERERRMSERGMKKRYERDSGARDRSKVRERRDGRRRGRKDKNRRGERRDHGRRGEDSCSWQRGPISIH